MSNRTRSIRWVALLGLFVAVVLIGGASWGQKPSGALGPLPVRDGSPEQGRTAPAFSKAKGPALNRDFGRVPVFFVPNRGQTDGRVSFTVKGIDKTVYFAPDGVTFALDYPAGREGRKGSARWSVKLDFLGARKAAKPEGLEETGAHISYFKGKPEEWKTTLPAYSRIIYRDLWPGIDLVYKGELDKLKYELIIRPGADPTKIRLAYRGAERVVLTEEGRLAVTTPVGVLEDDIPVAYQEVDGQRTVVPLTYSLEGVTENEGQAALLANAVYAYSFAVGEYDSSRPLVIDPAVLVYCGYIGGTNSENAKSIAVDTSGNVYVTGWTTSDETSFPVTVGPDLTYGTENNSFVAKINASGTGLVYCGYFSSMGGGDFCGIAVDDSGNAYFTKSTSATEATFPVTVGPDLTHNGGLDAFVAKINPSGTALVYCGYIGGSKDDVAMGIAVDDSGNAYIAGQTFSTEATFPVKIGPDLTYNGDTGSGYEANGDIFVAKVSASGTGLDYCGYIGGSKSETANGIAVDSSGNAYITGMTTSTEATFPVIVGPDLTYNGGDGFVAKVNASGIGLAYCGYIAGMWWPKIAADGSGHAYLSGTASSSLPTVVGPDLTYNGGDSDVFVAKLNLSGSAFDYCGFVGGSEQDGNSAGIAVDQVGNLYITGDTWSDESTFPVVDGPDLTYNGGQDAFVAKVDSSGTFLVYCGYIGGANADQGYGMAVDQYGNAYICGNAQSNQSTFPVLEGPDLTYSGGQDAFVAKISDIPGPPIASLSPDSANAGDPGFLLSVIGSEFLDGAIVRWNGSIRPTTFVSEFEVDATIDAADLVAGKTVYVTVRNPNGGVSNSLLFTINNPVPSLTSVSPTQVTGGGAAFTLTVQGSNFVPNSIVRWNGSDRATTYVSDVELQASITAADIATGGEVQITVYNPAPSGGVTSAVSVQVSSFTISASPTSVTVTAGQSATYTVQVTPQYGSFDDAIAFSCTGLPGKCTATFSSPIVTPGGAAATTTLTLETKASAGSAAASLFGTIGFGPPTLGLLAFVLTLLLAWAVSRRLPWRARRRWLAACALVCLVLVIGGCSSGGDDNNPPAYTGTPKGTHTISVQATSGNMTVPTAITLVVN